MLSINDLKFDANGLIPAIVVDGTRVKLRAMFSISVPSQPTAIGMHW